MDAASPNPPQSKWSWWKSFATGFAAVNVVSAGLYTGLRLYDYFTLERPRTEHAAPANTQTETRVAQADHEAAQYKAAEGTIEGLITYLQNCRICEFKEAAERHLAEFYAEELQAAGYDRAKLTRFAAVCGARCADALVREAKRRLDSLDAEEAQFKAALDSSERLNVYLQNCKGCEFRGAAEQRLAALRAKDMPAAEREVAKDPPVSPPTPGRDPDVEYQQAVRLDSLEGYEAFLRDFPNYPKRAAILSLIEHKEEEKLWAEAETAPSEAEKLRIYDRLLLAYPQGVYSERARQKLADLLSRPAEHTLKSGTDSAAPSFYYVTGLDPNGNNWLALRTAPSFQAPWSTTHMGPDTLLTVIDRSGEWLQVRLQNGETGWANSKYVACCKTGNEPQTQNVHRHTTSYYYVAGVNENSKYPWLALRNAPSFNSSWSATQMPNGTLLKVLERSDEWYHVRLNSGETGWANSKYVTCCREIEE